MSGITDPSEEYFKNGLWAWVTNQWKKLVADASNFLQVNIAAQDIDIEIKQTAAADLTPGVCGWDGSAWRKLPLLWGYSELAGEDLLDTNVGAGADTLDGAAVSSGEILVVTQVAIRYDGTPPSTIHCYPNLTPGRPIILAEYSVTSTRWYYTTCSLILAEGDHMRCAVAGATAGDDLFFRYAGYKMKITE